MTVVNSIMKMRKWNNLPYDQSAAKETAFRKNTPPRGGAQSHADPEKEGWPGYTGGKKHLGGCNAKFN
jgi:hypothetical protein